MSGKEIQSTIINDKLRLSQRDDQIYCYVVINKATIDIETVEKMTKIGDEWNGDKLCANLIDLRDMYFVDSKTRNYAAAQYREHVAGQAILVDSRISSSFANLFLKFSRPKVPTKLFTTEKEAIKWLKNQMDKRR